MRRTIRLVLIFAVLIGLVPALFRPSPVAAQGACPPPSEVIDGVCLHIDPPEPGEPIGVTSPPVPDALLTAGVPTCIGTGSDGPRVQVLYARASDVASRFAQYRDSIRTWASNVNLKVQETAGATGGVRSVRFVHDANCIISVLEAVLPTTGDDTFANTVSGLRSLGYNKTDRKYLVWMDSTLLSGCGVGSLFNHDIPGSTNSNNGGDRHARIESDCWASNTPTHELMHMLGAVQQSSPNSTGAGWHCTDEWDRMCYDDDGAGPVEMTIVCDDTQAERFDCNHDDFFHTNPAGGSYLATHWNVANSIYLEDNNLDTTPPAAVTITAPAASATITGPSVSVTATATDVGSGVTSMVFFWCQSLSCTGFGRDLTAPFAATWNTGAMPNGAYTLKATAFDATGNRAGSAPVAVTISH